MNKKALSIILTLTALLFSYFFLPQPKRVSQKKIKISPTKTFKVSTSSARVVRVIDGDTIELEDKQKLRYIGMDTPELHDPRKPVQCFAQEAYEKNKELVEGKVVILEKDGSEKDRYGRLLRYVYLPQQEKETTSSGFMINDYLVRQGFAHSVSYPPDIKYQEQFSSAQTEAREKNLGLWNLCK